MTETLVDVASASQPRSGRALGPVGLNLPGSDLEEKMQRLRSVVDESDTLVLTSEASLGWLLDGARVGVALAGAPVLCASVSGSSVTIHCYANEADRLEREELPATVEIVAVPWQDSLAEAATLSARTPLVWEAQVQDRLRAARASLLPLEAVRYRALCRDASTAFTDVVSTAEPWESERRLAVRLRTALTEIGAEPLVVLVAGESRLGYRHPLPTDAPLGQRVMLVACARRHGMIANLTRWITFSPLSAAQRDADARILEVEADIFDASRIGHRLSDIFDEIVDAYSRHGFPADTWTQHHQGGPTGYLGRDPRATNLTHDRLAANQALAWNPSAWHTKVEDTVLLGATGIEVLTLDPRWPVVNVRGRLRPVALEL